MKAVSGKFCMHPLFLQILIWGVTWLFENWRLELCYLYKLPHVFQSTIFQLYAQKRKVGNVLIYYQKIDEKFVSGFFSR